MGLRAEWEPEALRTVSARVALEAAELVRSVRDEAVSGGSVDTKSTETDVVTAGDRAAERLVRRRLEELRPGEPILGEEGGGADGLEGLRWVVDPIDGTVNYLYGYPWYAVSLAAQVDGRSIAGAVVEPVSGRVWTAAQGRGATLDGHPLRTTSSDRLDLALIGTGFAYSAQRRARQAEVVRRLLSEIRDIRRGGAASLDLCAVAAGWLDGYFEVGLNRWDWAAGALIATEAGAELRVPGQDVPDDPRDSDGLGDMVVCASPGIADGLTETLVRIDAADV